VTASAASRIAKLREEIRGHDRKYYVEAAAAISDRDYLYVLSTFVCEPIRWLARYGWRALSAEEEEAH
jgi:hypothetical protein